MAGKEYQVIFQFKAALDSSMSKSFGGVSQEIDKLTEKQMALQSALAEAKNMQAYKQHLEELRSELSGLTQAEQTATQALEKAVFARREAQQEEKAHADRIAELKTALKSENDEHREIIARLKDEKASKEEINAENLRHAQAVKKINDELSAEQRALRKSTDARKEAERAEKEAEGAKRAATNAVTEQNRKIAEEEAQLRRCSDALKAAGYDTKNLDAAINGMSSRLAEVNERLAEATRRQQEIDAAMASWERRSNNLRAMAMALDLMASGAEKVWDIISGSMDAAAGLEKQISAVKAISGATQQETADITKMIRETGATTVFTAEEVAEATQRMALAGWEAQQMIAGIPSVVNLAAAAGEDLESMTSIVADGMNAFQLSGERAALKFSDVLAKAATSSNTTVGLMGESLSYVETTAGNLGYSIEDVSIALAMMANNALKGSVAGSALNTMLTRMSGANATAANQMEEMGLTMYDEYNRAKPLKQFLDELREAFKGFGDDAQAAQIAAYRLAGQRGMRGLLALVNLNDEAYQKLTEDIYDFNGAANQIGTERLENYSGKMQLLSDAWTDFKITLGNQVLPTATDTVEMLTEMVNKAKDLAETTPTLTLWAADTSLAIMGLSKVMSGASSVAQSLYYIIKTLGMAGIAPGAIFTGLGYAGLAAVGFGGIAAIYQSWYNSDEYKELMTGLTVRDEIEAHISQDEMLPTSAGEVFEAAGAATGTASEKIAAFDDAIKGYDESIATARKDVENANNAYSAFIQKMKDEGKYKYENVYMGDDMNGPVYQQVLDITGMDADEVKNMHILEEEADAARQHLDSLYAARGGLQRIKADMIQQLKDEIGVQKLSVEQYEQLEGKARDVATAWAEVWEATYEAYSSVFGLFDKVEPATAKLSDMEGGLESQAEYWKTYGSNLDALKTVAGDAGIELGALWGELGKGDTQSAAYLQEIIKSLGELDNPDTSELVKLVELYNNAEEAKQAAVDAFDEGSGKVQKAMQEYSDNLKGIVESTESYDEAKTAMEKTMAGFVDGIESEDDAVLAAARRFRDSLQASLTPTVTQPFTYTPTFGFRGFAGGTGNATPGPAIVGERGPELLMMRGGERVIPAGQTSRLLALASSGAGGGGIVVNVNVAGSANAQTVADLRAYGNELESTVRRVLRQERVNAQRRAYS